MSTKTMFQENEELGRTKFKTLFNTFYKDIEFEPKEYEVYDAIGLIEKEKPSKSELHVFEIKRRSDDYINTSMMIEEDKYNNLKKIKDKYTKDFPDYKIKVFYIFVFEKSDRFNFIEIDKIITRWEVMNLQKNNYKTDYKLKRVSFIEKYCTNKFELMLD